MSKIIGIDLGTTNSCVSVMEGGEVKILENSEGHSTTPSVVVFKKDGERVVGDTAKRQIVTNHDRSIYSVKRFMGRMYNEIGSEMEEVPYKVIKGKKGDARIIIQNKEYSPPEISAMILQKMRQTAEEKLGTKVTEAVITVPAYFNDAQRQATKDAGKIAGLNVRRIINEPTAAALAYGLDKKTDGKIAVYDLGGGTFDISILEIGDGVFEVKSTNGDTHLGGDDFDKLIINWLVDQLKSKEGIDIRKDEMALQRLREAAEKAKIELSSNKETEINLPYISVGAAGPIHMLETLSRAKFNSLTEALIERSRKPCLDALKDAKLSPSDISDVILVGGSTRIPAVQELVKAVFKREPNKSMNPDEVVASGAAIQGGVLSGDVDDLLLLDVTPLSLGIETLGGVSTVLIERNTTIPTKKSQIFSTAADNQPSVEIHVLQGERSMSRDNKSIGKFHLDGIPPAPRGIPQIEVTFDIDANGILNVSAKDKATGKEQSVHIETSSGLSDAEKEKMVNDAKEHESEDKKRKDEIDTRNQVDSSIYQTEKNLKEYGDKLDDAAKEKINAAVEDLKKAKESNDLDTMKKSLEEMNQTWSELSTKMYEQAQQQQPQGGAEQPGAQQQQQQESQQNTKKDENDIEDADFEVVDDEK